MSAPPRVVPLTDEIQPAVLDYLRGAVYRNALLIANASQVRSRCDVIAALDGPAVVGVASTYSDLPLTNLTFAADSEDIASRLLETLVTLRASFELVWGHATGNEQTPYQSSITSDFDGSQDKSPINDQ